jgi:hypothetical protein
VTRRLAGIEGAQTGSVGCPQMFGGSLNLHVHFHTIAADGVFEYETVNQDSFVSIERAERRLGYRPQHSNRSALCRNFDWYAESRPTRARAPGVTHRTPWKQGALDVVKHAF